MTGPASTTSGRAGATLDGAPMVLHATAIALRLGGFWRGVLLQGPSGAGKSDLAIRALQRGWRLVADDRTLVWRAEARLFARAPERLSGLIEARHFDVVPAPPLAFVELVLAIACEPEALGLERIPEPEHTALVGGPLPLIRLKPREASALAKAEFALAAQGRRL